VLSLLELTGHLLLDAILARFPVIHLLVIITIRGQILLMEQLYKLDLNGHQWRDVIQDKSHQTLHHVITIIKDQIVLTEPLLPNGHPSPDATQDKFHLTLVHVIIITRDLMHLMVLLLLNGLQLLDVIQDRFLQIHHHVTITIKDQTLLTVLL